MREAMSSALRVLKLGIVLGLCPFGPWQLKQFVAITRTASSLGGLPGSTGFVSADFDADGAALAGALGDV
ncbi:MAG TPA: hypothetical protein VJS66_00165 [Burkholderiales bacterium]|nr:hypothetical protein [Burkholderiales bacterium]